MRSSTDQDKLSNDDFDQLILQHFPYPLAINYQRLQQETLEAGTRRAIRVFEFGLRTVALQLVSQYIQQDIDEIPDVNVNRLLLRKFSRATMGTWKELFFTTLKAYSERRDRLACPEMAGVFLEGKRAKVHKGIQAPFDKIIEIRNELAHGLPPQTKAGWQELFNETRSHLRTVLQNFSFLEEYDVVLCRPGGAGRECVFFTGLEPKLVSEPLPPGMPPQDNELYLRHRDSGRLSTLHPLVVPWQPTGDGTETIEAKFSQGDTAIYDRFSKVAVRYLATVVWENVILHDDSETFRDFFDRVASALDRLRVARYKAPGLTWSLLKDTTDKISLDRYGDFRLKHRRKLYLQRKEIQQVLDQFLASNKVGLVLLGESGVGKSSFFMSLMEKHEDNPEVSVLAYNGALFDTAMGLPQALALDFGRYLALEGMAGSDRIKDILLEINKIEEMAEKKLVLLIDALNENPDAKELLRKVDSLLMQAGPYPWLKVLVSSRPETWRTITRDMGLSQHRYYRKDETEPLETEMHPFNEDELPKVYARYRKEFDLQTSYGEILSRVRRTLRDPLKLLLVAETYRGKELPPVIDDSALIPQYIDALVEAKRLSLQDLRFLERELMPLMIREGGYINWLTADVISDARTSDGKELFELIYSDEVLNSGRRVNQSYANLVDSGILLDVGGIQDYEIMFKHESFWDSFGGDRLFALIKGHARPAELCLSIIQNIAKHPYMWGVLLHALPKVLQAMGENGQNIILQLASSQEQDSRDLAATVLVEYSNKDSDLVNTMLQTLYPIPSSRRSSGAKENKALVAVEIAGKLQVRHILLDAAAARSQQLRNRAVVQIYELWRQDSVAGFGILEKMVQSVGLKTLLLGRGLIESAILLSVLIFLKHFGDSEASSTVRDIWKPVIERFFFYRPESTKGEKVKSFLRKQMLWLPINVVSRLVNEIPSRYTVINFPELKAFYRLPQQVKDVALELTAFLDPSYGEMQTLEEKLLVLFDWQVDGTELNDMFLHLLMDYVLVAQSMLRFEQASSLATKLQDKELDRPNEAKRVMWNKSWVFGSFLLVQPEIDESLIDLWTRSGWRCAAEVKVWRGALGEYADLGYADYARLYVKRYGTYQVPLLKDLVEWATSEGNALKVRDILQELGYLTSSPEWRVVLEVIEPVLAFRTDDSEMDLSIRAKLVDVLAAIWNRFPYETDAFLDEQGVPGELREQIRVRKTDQQIGGDLLKGGLGPWGQFVVREAFSPQGISRMSWITRAAIQAKSLNHFLLQLAQGVVNLIYGSKIFDIDFE